ncbi:hypothetical protein BB561_006759 [Smittium simulii]|uniref:VLRF1 domain-containing protein n=1 Tax=Smittium simulii TaxID=133385 RepID=A0A2T9Y1T1_9FUNG|nr:hypothetical protein BB561_006759 [Smittium simulii]
MKKLEIAAFKIFDFPKPIIESIIELSSQLETKPSNNTCDNQLIYSTLSNNLEQRFDSNTIISNKASCLLCSIPEFTSVVEQRLHFKSQEHGEMLLKKISTPKSLESTEQLTNFSSANISIDTSSNSTCKNVSNIDPHNNLFLQDSIQNENLTAKIWFGSKNLSSLSSNHKDFSTPIEKQNLMTQYGIYKATVYDKKLKNKSDVLPMLRQLCLLQNNTDFSPKIGSLFSKTSFSCDLDLYSSKRYWAILQLSGGHFAGGVFDNYTQKLVAHKTFHRYTTRKKQGKSQLSHDNAKGQLAKSAGAQLRRYNEQKLLDDINDTINSWSHYLVNCSRIFQNTSKASRKVFLGKDNSPVPYSSDVVRICPIQVKRPSLKEVTRVYQTLTSVYIRNFNFKLFSNTEIQDSKDVNLFSNTNISLAPNPASSIIEDQIIESQNDEYDTDDTDGTDGTLEPEPRPELVEFLYDAAVIIQDTSKSNKDVLNFLESNKEMLLDAFLDPATELRYLEKCPLVEGSKTPTLLHLAAFHGRNEAILFLLDHGDDPSITNGYPIVYSGGKTAYELSLNKSIRDIFRKYRFDNEKVYKDARGVIIPPDKYSEWNATRIPSGWKDKFVKNFDKSKPLPTRASSKNNSSFESNSNTQSKNKETISKNNKNKDVENNSKPNLVDELTKKLIETSLNNSNIGKTNGEGILDQVKNKNLQWGSQNSNSQEIKSIIKSYGGTTLLSSLASTSKPYSAKNQYDKLNSMSNKKTGNRGSVNTSSDNNKPDIENQRELRAKAAEARLARLSKNTN